MARIDRNSLSSLEKALIVPTNPTPGHQNPVLGPGYTQFDAGSFGPGYPIQPFPLDNNPSPNNPPRITEYLPGWNYPMTPGAGKLLPFPVLRSLAAMVLPARVCINLRRHELATQEWDIVLKPQYHDKAKDPEIQDKREQLLEFFSYPDPYQGMSFASWIQCASEEVDVIDALSVYLRPTISPTGGILNSGLHSLNLIDGSLIRPLRDTRGGRPQAPAPAYQAYLYGAPRTNLFAVNPSPLEEEGDTIAKFTTNELVYMPFNRRVWDVYGASPVEFAIQEVKLWIDRERYHQSYFDNSDIPGMFIEVPKEWSGTQLMEYEQKFNARLAGDPRWRWRVKMIPGGTGVHYVKPVQYDMQFDEWLIRLICMAFDVAPEELGLSPKGGLGGGGWAEEAAQRQNRLSLQPRLIFFAELFNTIIRKRLKVEEFQFQWIDFSHENIRDKAFADTEYVKEGIRTRAEVREDNGWDALDIPGINDLLVTTRQGTLPLEVVTAYGVSMDHASGTVNDTRGEGGDTTPTLPPAPLHGATQDRTDRQAKPLSREAIKMLQADDLKKWQRLLRSRGVLMRPFQSESLPKMFKDQIELLANHVPEGKDVDEWRVRLFKSALQIVEEAANDEVLDEYEFLDEIWRDD